MDENELRIKIIKLLENAFVARRAIAPEEVARELAKTVSLPVDDLTEKVTSVAKGLGVGVKPSDNPREPTVE